MYSLENSLILHEAGKARYKAHLVLQLIIFVAVFIVTGMAAGLIVGFPMGIYMSQEVLETVNPADLISGKVDMMEVTRQLTSRLPEWFNVLTLAATAITTFLTIVYCRKIEGRSYASMGLVKTRAVKQYGLGLVIGTVMILATVALAISFGAAAFTGFNKDVSWLYIVLFFVVFLIQGMSEEVVFRGYFAVTLANKTKVSVAIAISSIAFAMAHLGNAGIAPLAFINLALFGAFMGFYVFRTDDLWGACAIHSAWNFVQGNIVGISVSGGAFKNSVFGTTFIEGKELINGGAFGIEGGMCTTIVLLAAIALTLYLPMEPRPALPAEQNESPAEEREAIPLYIKK